MLTYIYIYISHRYILDYIYIHLFIHSFIEKESKREGERERERESKRYVYTYEDQAAMLFFREVAIYMYIYIHICVYWLIY